MDHPAPDVSSDQIRPQPMDGVGRLVEMFQFRMEGVVPAHPGSQEGGQDDDSQEDRATAGEPVAQESSPGSRTPPESRRSPFVSRQIHVLCFRAKRTLGSAMA